MAELKKDEKIIQLVNVTKAFDETVAVENVSFYVRKGEFITFLGPSGCGKTTTLRMIAGFDIPDLRQNTAQRAGHYEPTPEQETGQYGVPAVRALPPPEHL